MFYGMIGFAKALIVAQDLRHLASLVPAHGLKDISAANSRIEDLRVKVLERGTFQQFNDVIAAFNRVTYLDSSSSQYQTISRPAAGSACISGLELSLKEILSRIPTLDGVYRMTFGEPANTELIGIGTEFRNSASVQISFGDRSVVSDKASLEKLVQSIRERFPFLQAWRLAYANYRYQSSDVYFTNIGRNHFDEFSDENLAHQDGEFHVRISEEDESLRFPIRGSLRSVASFPGLGLCAISPIRDEDLSEFSLHYLGLFILSSLVRYRPQVWAHAISRSAMAEQPPDDRALSLIELFLEKNSSTVPAMIVSALNPHEGPFG
jgi:hypothetical protein